MNIQTLLSRLDTSSDHSAEKVIARLVKVGKAAVSALLKAARDESRPRVRKWSLQALGSMGDKRAVPLLVGALRDERMTVRLHALKGLARLRARKAARPVARLLKDESGGIRVNALYTLVALGDASVGAAVVRCLADPQWYVRQAAAEACGELGLVVARAKLRALVAKDKRKAVKSAAKAALAKLG